jgi:hypothetical protein
VINAYINGQLDGARPYNDHKSSHIHEHNESSRLQEEIVALRGELAKETERLRRLEKEKER